jgi:mono/diheme cytochrome c family protein
VTAVCAIVVLVVLSWVPLALIFRSRTVNSPRPRLHVFLDMDQQPFVKTQAASALFADGRASRPVIEGTVARSAVFGNDHYALGYKTDDQAEPVMVTVTVEGNPVPMKDYYAGYPAEVTVDLDLLKRGREQYDIYCGICHAPSGDGNGVINQRAQALNVAATAAGEAMPAAGWVPPRDLHIDRVRNMTEGQLYDIVVAGVPGSKMPGYGSLVTEYEDRWAIVAYIKALQLSKTFPASSLAALGVSPREMNETEVAIAEKAEADRKAAEAAAVAAAAAAAAGQVLEMEDNKPEGVADGDAKNGALLFMTKTCVACHTVQGPKTIAPSFTGGIIGKTEMLSNGVEVLINDAYVRESVKAPQAKITKGYEQIPMAPLYPALINDQEVEDLIAYLKTLSK